MKTLRVSLVALAACVLSTGCMTTRVRPPEVPAFVEQIGKCQVASGQNAPLVTEWPASEKANLESLLRRGGVAVTFSGCEMRVVAQCPIRGGYTWQRTSPATDVVEINDENELYAKLPLGAAALEGELKRWGKLSVQTQISGLLRLEGGGPYDIPAIGECSRATHVITALSVGAFTLSTGGGGTIGGGADVQGIGGGARSSQGTTVTRSSGDGRACWESTDQSPHPNCSSPIQVFLAPIPGRAAEEGPPGTVKVDLVSGTANSRWDVYVDDAVICTTPCSKWLDPSRPVYFRTREDGPFVAPDKIKLSNLDPYTDFSGPLQLQAQPTDRAKLATGITFTSLGGMAMMTGLTLSGVSCLGNRFEGMCTGGLISLATGSVITAGAIWLITQSMPIARIAPLMRGGPRLVATPGGVAGNF
jgi:hypothetical protein